MPDFERDFQREFARALFAPNGATAPSGVTGQAAFFVYRNTVMKGLIDALQANYPSVVRLVGSEWFRAAAAVFVAQHPAREPCLLRYGARFADFLASFRACC